MRKKYINFFISEIFVIFVLGLVYLITKDTTFSKCIIFENFHFFCPTCGGTRSVINFVQMNWKQSYEYHPIFFLTMLYILIINIIFLINIINNKENFKSIYPNLKKYIIFIVVLIFFTIVRNL